MKARIWIATGLAVAIGVPIGLAIWVNWAFSDLFAKKDFYYQGAEAKQMYEEKMKWAFAIPKEAEILKLKYQQDWVDENYWLTFDLPKGKSPESWMEAIWKSNGFSMEGRASSFKYSIYYGERGHDSKVHHGLRELSFDRESGHFMAVFGTD